MESAMLPHAKRTPVNLLGGNDHPIVSLPFTAFIDGRQFRGWGLSLVAAYVAGLMDPAAQNTTRIVRLMFQFDGFSVTLVVDAKVREGTNGHGEVELVFLRPSGEHLSQLRHILNAYIAGDLVSLGQTIGVAGTTAPKNHIDASAQESRLSLRRLAGSSAILLLSLALLATAGTLVYQRLFVALVPTLGTVVSTGEVMRATTTGQVVFLDMTARQGDVVVAIQAASGDVQSLVMPCDCGLTSTGLREGSTVLIGEPLLQLAAETDERLVSATIPAEMLFELVIADRIELTFPDGSKTFANAEPGQAIVDEPDARPVLLRPDGPLGAEHVGAPVQIRILHDPGFLPSWTDDARTRLVSFFKGV